MDAIHVIATKLNKLRGVPDLAHIPERRLLAAIVWRAALDVTLDSLPDEDKESARLFLDSDFAQNVGEALGVNISSERLQERLREGYEVPRVRR